jgi:hypothetical protein
MSNEARKRSVPNMLGTLHFAQPTHYTLFGSGSVGLR